MLAKLKDKETWRRYFGSLKFALYCTTHPLDGYWDLTHEKRGTIAAANTILVLTLITRILELHIQSGILAEGQYFPLPCRHTVPACIVVRGKLGTDNLVRR